MIFIIKNECCMGQVTDEIGKGIAHQLFDWLGSEFQETTEEYDILDGRFNYNGKVYGVEIKYVSPKRYTKYDDIIIATNKYEYSIGEGKVRSGLTATYMLTYTPMKDETICMLVPFTKCLPSRKITKFAPNHHTENTTYSNHPFYSVPRSEARKFKITKEEIIEI